MLRLDKDGKFLNVACDWCGLPEYSEAVWKTQGWCAHDNEDEVTEDVCPNCSELSTDEVVFVAEPPKYVVQFSDDAATWWDSTGFNSQAEATHRAQRDAYSNPYAMVRVVRRSYA